jgi:nitrite reductase/ring-hydroxylating ferredoxin subunit
MEFICAKGDVEDGTARSFRVANESLIVVHSQQHFYVYRNRCPHLGIPLEWQPDDLMDPDGDLVRCSTHGALFMPDTGECVAGPCAGDHLTKINFVIRDGKLWLS